MSTRLAPTISRDTEFYWNGLREQKLLIQRCGGCGTLRHPPRPMCPHCRSLSWEAIESSGEGTVYSYVMPHQPRFPFFDYPYIVALVELSEGVRLLSNLRDIDPDDVTVGMPVEVFYETFEGASGDLVLHQFRPKGLQ
ncbi:nucleic acid-binding protein [Mycobacterium intermedium]|uniref:Nucleic acid-binding protein n=1 Tax=Mycobacterium intermedium TaxID=28445 RepID=A0A1E3SDB5_MYCIE|nr:Zn-ribbon domain-containing OB-fold protein [Mycobacterium intermedium]MCV6965195.1 Zn-ribbon domain-containing OB-fold protein [Mycobacterium intermedium]ODR00075.1 nucleic acid-binding protein [Mycobacterium intermedium]OPE47174.1 nucleic acid-binding protein [Mycobacterium intermedium]ORA93520.1 nucleic acid-binding protein [Mycobacterium intermedium]